MIVIQSGSKSEVDLRRVGKLFSFLNCRIQQLMDDDPQQELYFSKVPIGSLGELWMAESAHEVMDKEFMELVQYDDENPAFFVGTWIPTNGDPCADIVIPAAILSKDELQQLMDRADQVIKLDETERF